MKGYWGMCVVTAACKESFSATNTPQYSCNDTMAYYQIKQAAASSWRCATDLEFIVSAIINTGNIALKSHWLFEQQKVGINLASVHTVRGSRFNKSHLLALFYYFFFFLQSPYYHRGSKSQLSHLMSVLIWCSISFSVQIRSNLESWRKTDRNKTAS